MIEEQAVVVACEGEFAVVETERRTACGGCAANAGCGTGVLAKVIGHRQARLQVLNPIGAKPAEQVVVGLAEQALVRGSAAIYLVPLLAMFVLGLLGDTLAAQLGFSSADAASALLGVTGLLGGFLWVKRFTSRIAHDQRYQPIILRRVKHQGQVATLHPHFAKE